MVGFQRNEADLMINGRSSKRWISRRELETEDGLRCLIPKLRGLAIVIYKRLFDYIAHPNISIRVYYAVNIRIHICYS
jgi:hypothetical protein